MQLGLLGFKRIALGSDVGPANEWRRPNGRRVPTSPATTAFRSALAMSVAAMRRGASNQGWATSRMLGDHETFGTDGESTECEAEQILGHFLFL